MTDDLGYFGPDSMTWRILADPAAGVGGIRALFLQALHPLAMAAVHEHAGFSNEFWPRLQRTAQYVTTVGFGTRGEADAAAARVRTVHQKVRGIDPVTGGRYAATNPDLLRWVHVAEVSSFLDAASRGGLPLTDAEADRFLAEQVRAARLVGLEDVPTSRAELVKYFQLVRSELRASTVARRAALQLAVPPLSLRTELATPARPAWTTVAGLAFALLPQWARRPLRNAGSAHHRPDRHCGVAGAAQRRATAARSLAAQPDRAAGLRQSSAAS